MSRRDYLQAVIDHYTRAPDTPNRPRRSDWAVASTLHHRRIPLETVLHAIRLASLRRNERRLGRDPLEPIHSLAYFRQVLDSLLIEALDPAYIDYVARRFDDLIRPANATSPDPDQKPRPASQNPALPDRR